MPDITWVNGKMGELATAQVPLLDRGYLFGDGVYEVIRVYRGRPFALSDHLERLERSASGIRLQIPLSRAGLESLILGLIDQAGYSEASAYLQITRGVSTRQHAFPADVKPGMILFVSALVPLGGEQWERGIKVVTLPDDRWAHCHIKSVNLLPNVLAKQRAHEQGAYEAVLVRENGRVSEGSSSNVFLVKDGVLKTPPLDGHILAGVTRKFALAVAQKEAYPVREEEVLLRDLRQADEVFLTSTTMELLPVTLLDEARIGTGVAGPVTRSLYQAFRGVI
ncbi:D-alanine aminotransferase [Peptococcaceae bacterium CEB3]|nr:D-alanine aminotransferase [Peptococcaceae bacterium CEB3]